VRHAKRKDADAVDDRFATGHEDVKFGRRKLARLRALAEHPLKQTAHALFGSFRTADVERALARMLVEVVDKEKRQAAVVVAVEVAQKNRVEPSRAEATALHRQERRRAAVEKKQLPAAFDQIAAGVSAAAAESVAAAEDVELHRAHASLNLFFRFAPVNITVAF